MCLVSNNSDVYHFLHLSQGDTMFLDDLEFIRYEVNPDWRNNNLKRLLLSVFGGSVTVIGAVIGASWLPESGHPFLRDLSEKATIAVFWPEPFIDIIARSCTGDFACRPFELCLFFSPFVSIVIYTFLIYIILSRLAKRPYQ